MDGGGRGILQILGCATIVVVGLAVGRPELVEAQQLTPIPHPIGAPNSAAGVAAARSRGGPPTSSWTPLTNQPTFFNGASSPLLLTDGTVVVQDTGFRDWWRLTPDQTGSYVNGTWSEIASLPVGYSPLYHSSAVLPDGRLIIEGGEYLLSNDQTMFVPTWSAKGRSRSERRHLDGRGASAILQRRISPRRRSAMPRASCWQTARTCRPNCCTRR